MTTNRRLLAIVTFCVLFGACAHDVPMYHGATDPNGDAELVAVPSGFGSRLDITKVDGERTQNPLVRLANVTTASVRVAPGKHEIALQWKYGVLIAYGHVSFVAEAGHRYELRAEKSGPRARFWIVDSGSGEKTADVDESNDPPSTSP